MSQNPLDSDYTTAESTDVSQESWRRLYANLRAFFSRFVVLAHEPRRFVPLVVDSLSLLRSIWSGRQLGPDLVYPLLAIRKRQSRRLAELILEHSKDGQSYELRATTMFPKGFDPPCVAMIDLDEVPQDVVESGYSTQADLYGLMCLLMLFETMITIIMHVSYISDGGRATRLNWVYYVLANLNFCFNTVQLGDGTLTLARRSDTSTPGCAVLLDEGFTVVLRGNESVVEAIAESSFILSHPNTVWSLPLGRGERANDRHSSYDNLGFLFEIISCILFVFCWLLFLPPGSSGWMERIAVRGIAAFLVLQLITCILERQMFPPGRIGVRQGTPFAAVGFVIRVLLPPLLLVTHGRHGAERSTFAFAWHLLPTFLFCLCSVGYNSRYYPIRRGRFLCALGCPRVRKWQFDTLAAAATFQCLILCRGIARPIRSINVLSFLDMLIPDQRDLWKTWKERVADRIVHETDILFAPTIPTFSDERQQQLKDLLDQAQTGYDAYRRFYDWHVPLHPVERSGQHVATGVEGRSAGVTQAS